MRSDLGRHARAQALGMAQRQQLGVEARARRAGAPGSGLPRTGARSGQEAERRHARAGQRWAVARHRDQHRLAQQVSNTRPSGRVSRARAASAAMQRGPPPAPRSARRRCSRSCSSDARGTRGGRRAAPRARSGCAAAAELGEAHAPGVPAWPLGHARHALAHGLHVLRQRGALGLEQAAGVGQRHAARMALEQLQAQLALQRLDLSGSAAAAGCPGCSAARVMWPVSATAAK